MTTMTTTINTIDDLIWQHLEDTLNASVRPHLIRLEDAIVRLDKRVLDHDRTHEYREALHKPSQSSKPSRHGHPWTHSEEQNLTTHIRLHIEEIARAHKRTPKAIAFKLMQIAEDYI